MIKNSIDNNNQSDGGLVIRYEDRCKKTCYRKWVPRHEYQAKKSTSVQFQDKI